MTQNKNIIDSRVAVFDVEEPNATFRGFYEPGEVKAGRGVQFTTLHGAQTVLDRHARVQNVRSRGAVPGTVVSSALLAGVSTFRKAPQVTAHRDALSAESRLARKVLKAFRAVNQL